MGLPDIILELASVMARVASSLVVKHTKPKPLDLPPASRMTCTAHKHVCCAVGILQHGVGQAWQVWPAGHAALAHSSEAYGG